MNTEIGPSSSKDILQSSFPSSSGKVLYYKENPLDGDKGEASKFIDEEGNSQNQKLISELRKKSKEEIKEMFESHLNVSLIVDLVIVIIDIGILTTLYFEVMY